MFEKEAEEWIKNNFHSTEEDYIKAFEDGAEFGYNKANEWHYMKDGLPKKDGFYLVAFHNIGCDAVDVGQFLRAEWWHSDEEIRVFINKNIYAWKELPNPPKDIEQMTEEQIFKAFPEYCAGERCLSPYFDLFQIGFEEGENQNKELQEKISRS